MGCAGEWRSSWPVAVTVFTPNPKRGLGQNRKAHIRVQKEPAISPAGTGTDYVHP